MIVPGTLQSVPVLPPARAETQRRGGLPISWEKLHNFPDMSVSAFGRRGPASANAGEDTRGSIYPLRDRSDMSGEKVLPHRSRVVAFRESKHPTAREEQSGVVKIRECGSVIS